MKNKIISHLIVFLIGGLIFGSIGVVVAINYKASDITYTPSDNTWNVDNAKDAIDDLKTKVKPEYTGLTTITPNTNSQTLYTNNKILNSNIIIEPIPSSYKNLLTTTTATANTILSGYTAYTNDGMLVTGNISPNCISGSHVWTQNDKNNGLILTNFEPKYFSISTSNVSVGETILYYNKEMNSTNYYQFYLKNETIDSYPLSTSTTTISNNSLIIKWTSSDWIGQTLHYMACK